jgi:hypothetical protein
MAERACRAQAPDGDQLTGGGSSAAQSLQGRLGIITGDNRGITRYYYRG